MRSKARGIEKNRQNQLALKRQESFSESQQQQGQEPFLDENDHEVRPSQLANIFRKDAQWVMIGNRVVQRRPGRSDACRTNYNQLSHKKIRKG